LQEGAYWVSGGKSFSIEETTCVAKGDDVCTILIGKQPLD
jgi:predicted hydrocarbon binding protein